MKNWFCATVVLLVLSASAAVPADKAYTFHVVGQNPSDAAQMKIMLKEYFKVAEKNKLFKVNLNVLENQDEFSRNIRDRRIHVFINNNFDYIWELLEDDYYKPLAKTSWFGNDMNALCVYVSNKNPAKDIKSMAGTRAVTYDRALAYFALRQMTGAPPEDFFSSLDANKSGISMAYSISLGENDAALFEMYTEKLMETTNPGAMSGLKRLSCVELPYPPLFTSKKMPSDVADKMLDFIMSHDRYEELAKYKLLEEKFKFKMVETKRGDYDKVVEVFRNAAKSGWDADYKRWIKMASRDKTAR